MFYSPPVAACCPRLVSSPLGLAWPGQPVSCSLPSKLGFFTTGIPTGSICAKSVWSCDLNFEPWTDCVQSLSVQRGCLWIEVEVWKEISYSSTKLQVIGSFLLWLLCVCVAKRVIDSQSFFYLFCLSLSNVLMENYYTNTCTFEGIESPPEPLPENWRKGWKGGKGSRH